MGKEIDLLVNYPKTKRNLEERATSKTEADRAIARQFGRDFFDGDRNHGYGGFNYLPRFWQPVIPTFQQHWNLDRSSSILDVGCAKGFMMHDLVELIPGITVKGIDISEYAIENSKEEIKGRLQLGNATSLPFEDHSFDFVYSITTLHNLHCYDLDKALREIERVGKKNKYICVESYRNEVEKANLLYWQVTCEAFCTPKEWEWWFKMTGFNGDYSFIYFE